MTTRVLQVIDGLRVGGAENVLLGLLELADEARLPMFVASVGPNDPRLAERVRAVSRDLFLLEARGLWDPRTVAALISIIRAQRIEVVQTHLAGADFQGGLAARLTGRPCVSVLHSVVRDRRTYGRARRLLANLATRHLADRIVAVSCAVKDSHVEELGIPSGRIVVIPNIPAAALLLDEHFDRERKRMELGLGESPVVTTAGRLDLPKDHRTLLRALPRVLEAWPDLIVLVIGGGSLREALESTARELGVERSVIFTGIRLDAVEAIAASDVFCHPALYEGFGLALAEAMAVGTPVVASKVSGIVELVENGRTGILVEAENPDALSGALIELLGDSGRRRRLAEEARAEIAARFDAGEWMRRIEDVYAEVVRLRRERPRLSVRLRRFARSTRSRR